LTATAITAAKGAIFYIIGVLVDVLSLLVVVAVAAAAAAAAGASVGLGT